MVVKRLQGCKDSSRKGRDATSQANAETARGQMVSRRCNAGAGREALETRPGQTKLHRWNFFGRLTFGGIGSLVLAEPG